MELVRTIEFDRIGDQRGSLISLEQNKDIPFDIARVYYIYDTKIDVIRGLHAHKDLQQVAVCVRGSCKFTLDNGFKKESIRLNKENLGLYIGSNIWREMSEFTDDCVLLVLASKVYDESDYIRDYNDFLENLNEEK
ncbi:sugar 3,4-ketoisomerase [Vibrio breoganii]|uniref:sugar 3,4-ketoisomerase n=1 Tax=Vibrio breoganii TaxID=553239 RepID=UPI000C81BF53|nr:FdtA/QdtA family cupin domain-containing protein [Vibrio breoganii]PML92250.1 dTDP-6-deoxy-3,4-keto-hexulose isomerase [Vibrio breoganii]PMN70189.1 dTDP-6-deoxy-3,4-keto-hexulose isomerase [Vibrio breoganii]